MMKQVKMAPSSGDATVTKQEIDHKLQLEEENVKWLQDRVNQSSDLTSGQARFSSLSFDIDDNWPWMKALY